MKDIDRFKKVFKRGPHWMLYALLLAALLVSTPGVSLIHTANSAATSGQPAWASPAATAVKRASDISNIQHQSNFLSNFDCTQLTYRLVSSSAMQTGCFTPTAFGMLDSSSEMAIFNGSDEGLPLIAHSNQQVLAPWPKALNLLTLDATNTGGSYIGMYKNPLASLQDQRDFKGQLTGKQLTAAPEISFKDAAGHPLVVNAQTLAGSDNGSWLVAETLNGSFIRLNLASLDQMPFAPAFGSQGSPGALLQSQVAVSDSGRYVAIGNDAASSFKVYDLAACGGSLCASHEYRPFVSQQVSGLQKIRHIRFINDGVLSFEATTNSGHDGVYELAPTGSITSLTDYIGLGDSYTSGEGAFDYLAGTDTADNTCHLSAKSYPLLLSHDLFSAAGGHSVACSGAVINDIAGTGSSYRGQVQHGSSLGELETAQSNQLNSILADYSPGYVPQQLFVKQYQPRVVTVSIGGNDISFDNILQECVVPHISLHASDETCYNTYESRQEVINLINRTVPRWIALYRQLQAASPGTTIYAIGYPSVVSDTGACPLNVNLGKSELEFGEELIHYLNGAVQQAAAAAGVPYVDISQALAGHRLCEASGSAVAVNGLTAGNDFGAFGINVLGRESYHPNALGHELIEQAILRQTNNLSVATVGQGAAANDSQNLLNAPKSGRPVNTLAPDIITSQLLRPGTGATIQVNGARDGLRPNSTYIVRLDGPSGTVLASLPSDSNGNLSGVAAVPGGTTPGGHTIDVTGSDQAGEPVDVKQPVYVANSTSDTDGDGVTDANDSCPYAINSGQDFDRDGIDDVCDSVIGPAPSTSDPSNIEPDNSPSASATANLAQAALSVPTLISSATDAQTKAISGSASQLIQTTQSDADNQSGGQVLGAGTDQATESSSMSLQPSFIRNSIARLTAAPGKDSVSGRLDGFVLISILMLLLLLLYCRRGIIKQCRIYLSALCNNWRKIDYKKLGRCFTIVIMRKFGVVVFSLVLFVSLLALAFSTSSNIAFTHPSKLEKWLNDSNLYGAFVENAIDQAEQTAGTDQSGGISLSDTAVKQAAESSFSSAALQKDVNTVLNSNYAWLNGKTSKPNFSVDLSGAKQNFAQKVGDYIKTYLATRPACTAAQAAQINPQTADPLTLNCLPPGVDPATVSTQVTEQIANSTEFLSNPVVTAANVNPNGSIGTPAQPYYQKFSSVPSAYRKATKIPWIAGALVIISLLAVIFIASRKRKGVKVIAVILALAGLVMVLTKFVSDQAFHSLEKHAFNASTVGELQKALTVFLRHAEDQLVKVDLWFGIGYLLLALVLLAILIITRKRGLRMPKRLQSAIPAADSEPEPVAPKSSNNTSAAPKPPRAKKPPRLVQ